MLSVELRDSLLREISTLQDTNNVLKAKVEKFKAKATSHAAQLAEQSTEIAELKTKVATFEQIKTKMIENLSSDTLEMIKKVVKLDEKDSTPSSFGAENQIKPQKK